MGSSGVQVEGNVRLGGRVRQVGLQERHLGREPVEEVRLSKVTRELVENLQGERKIGKKERSEWVRRKWTEEGGGVSVNYRRSRRRAEGKKRKKVTCLRSRPEFGSHNSNPSRLEQQLGLQPGQLDRSLLPAFSDSKRSV